MVNRDKSDSLLISSVWPVVQRCRSLGAAQTDVAADHVEYTLYL